MSDIKLKVKERILDYYKQEDKIPEEISQLSNRSISTNDITQNDSINSSSTEIISKNQIINISSGDNIFSRGDCVCGGACSNRNENRVVYLRETAEAGAFFAG